MYQYNNKINILNFQKNIEAFEFRELLIFDIAGFAFKFHLQTGLQKN